MALAATATAMPALAEGVAIFPYASKQNHCPEGLQPVSIDGVICCGTPNQTTSYQQMKAVHRAAPRATVRSRIACPVGAKGCVTE
jgi:hypothetical protein